MKTILISVVCLLLFSCAKSGIIETEVTSKYVIKTESMGRVKIEGRASNSARGATITKPDGMFYVLDGIQDCPSKYFDQNVTVSGQLFLITQTPKDSNEVGIYNSRYYKIVKPKFLKLNSSK